MVELIANQHRHENGSDEGVKQANTCAHARVLVKSELRYWGLEHIEGILKLVPEADVAPRLIVTLS